MVRADSPTISGMLLLAWAPVAWQGALDMVHFLHGRKSEQRILAALHRAQATAALDLLAICLAFCIALNDMSSICYPKSHKDPAFDKFKSSFLAL